MKVIFKNSGIVFKNNAPADVEKDITVACGLSNKDFWINSVTGTVTGDGKITSILTGEWLVSDNIPLKKGEKIVLTTKNSGGGGKQCVWINSNNVTLVYEDGVDKRLSSSMCDGIPNTLTTVEYVATEDCNVVVQAAASSYNDGTTKVITYTYEY